MVVTIKYNEQLKKTYSTDGFFISPVGEPDALYIEAIDPIESDRSYIETNIPIDMGEDSE